MKAAIILLFLLPVLLPCLVTDPVIATTNVVPDDYLTIQEAISASGAGDTVYVRAGTYYEHLTIGESLTLRGEDRDGTVIDGSGTGDVVYVTSDYVTIEELTVANGEIGVLLIDNYTIDHFTIRNAVVTGHSGYGIRAPHNNSSSYHAIEDCIFSYNATVLFAHQFGYSAIRRCELYGNGAGLFVGWGSYTTICDNESHDNSNTCIHIDSGTYNTVERNNIHDNTAAAIAVGYVGNNNTIRENILRNNSTGINLSAPGIHSNRVYHNVLIGNTTQGWELEGDNSWDDGYPSGGNYWSDYVGVDHFSGPNQDIPGPDGIGDTPYMVGDAGIDHYPLYDNPVAIEATTWSQIKMLFH